MITDTLLDAIDATKAPDDPPAVQDDYRDGIPVKLYSPKGASAAMLAGRVLKDEIGHYFFWKDRGKDGVGFWFRDNKYDLHPVLDFSGLYEEARHG
jgi:hypothetical protein